MITLHPNTVFDSLTAPARGIKLRNLKKIHEICAAQYTAKALDFSLAHIGRLSEQAGGVGQKALYNRTSEDYKTLINAWADFVTAGPGSASPKQANDSHDDILLAIQDPALRALVGAAFAERNRLRRELSVLKNQTNIVVDRRPIINQVPGAYLEIKPELALTGSERRALERAIAPTTLENESWTEGANGEIKNHKGRNIFQIGFTSAIRKMLNQQ